jgi:nucleotide-binding universal stress UspA family protein
VFQRILVPLDGSKLAEQVFPAVIELAGAFGSRVFVIGVCDSGLEEESQSYRLYLYDMTKRLSVRLAHPGASVESSVLSGRPSEQILHYVETNKIDLIIMSSHGRSGITPWPMGSTVDKIFKKAGVPLIVVKAREKPGINRLFNRIVVPLDGSDKSLAVIPYVKEIAGRILCEVYPIRVMESGKHVRTVGGLNYVRFPEQDMAAAKAAAMAYLEEVSSGIASSFSGVHCEVNAGEAASEILKFSDEIGCTLIAMTSHGHHGIETWALGSVTSKITAVGKQSIFLVPSFTR